MNSRHLLWLARAAWLCAWAPLAAQQVCDTQRYALSSPDGRFADNGDGTVTDKESNLMWMRCSEGQAWLRGTCAGPARAAGWAAAQSQAELVNRDGHFFYDDWRLPNLREIATIAERQCTNPRLNLKVFPNTPAAAYWTSTSRGGDEAESAAFVLSFGGEGFEHRPKDEAHYVRLVRSNP